MGNRHTDYAIPFFPFATFIVSLPLIGFIFCVAWSLKYNFEESTATHCRVDNYLPSTSAAIGGYTPQRYVWQILIALHITPRFMLPIAYYNWFLNRIVPSVKAYMPLATLASVCHALELLGLVGLSYVTSNDDKASHEKFFIMFMFFSEVYMVLMLYLMRQYLKHSVPTPWERLSYRIKLAMFLTNIGSFVLALYFYWRHNEYCEPGVYTFFALFEYFLIVANVGFNWTSALDFPGRYVVLTTLISSPEKSSYLYEV